MDAELKWAIGLAIGLATAFVTAMVGAFKNLSGRMSDSNKDLHGRIDDVKEKYVRRDDQDKHIARIEQNIREMRDEQRENHKQILSALTRKI